MNKLSKNKTIKNGKQPLYFISLWLLLTFFWALASLFFIHQTVNLANHWGREATLEMLQPLMKHVLVQHDYRELQNQLQELGEKNVIEYFAVHIQYPDTAIDFSSAPNAPEDQTLLHFPIRFQQKREPVTAIVSILPKQTTTPVFIQNHLAQFTLLIFAIGFLSAFFLYFLYYLFAIKPLQQLAETINQSFPDSSEIQLKDGIFSALNPRIPQLKSAIKRLAHKLKSYRQKERTVRNRLNESKENFQRITETARDIILVHDMEGNIIYVNDAGLKFTGFSRAELINSKITDFVPPEYLKAVAERKEKRSKGWIKKSLYEIEFINRQGDRVPIEISSAPIVSDGKIANILIIARNISERKKVEKELATYRTHLQDLIEKRTAELEEKNRELERLNDLFVGREFRIKELKEKVKILTDQMERLKQKLESQKTGREL